MAGTRKISSSQYQSVLTAYFGPSHDILIQSMFLLTSHSFRHNSFLTSHLVLSLDPYSYIPFIFATRYNPMDAHYVTTAWDK